MTVSTTARRWNPWTEILALQNEMSRMFDPTAQFAAPGRGTLPTAGFAPAVDVLRHEDELVVKVDLPGMKKEDLEITLLNNRLSIRGEKKDTAEVQSDRVHRTERFFGRFERVVELPNPVDGEKIRATFTDGVLEVHAPLRAEAKPRQITVETA